MVTAQQRRLTNEVKQHLRELNNQVALLNRQVGGVLEIRDVDLDCLDLISRHGPLSPSTVAKSARMHPATMTGILDRLERAGWITRERDPNDRRSVLVRAVPSRAHELFGQYAGMNSSMDDLCASFDEKELAVISRFLGRAADAGRAANAALTDKSGSDAGSG